MDLYTEARLLSPNKARLTKIFYRDCAEEGNFLRLLEKIFRTVINKCLIRESFDKMDFMTKFDKLGSWDQKKMEVFGVFQPRGSKRLAWVQDKTGLWRNSDLFPSRRYDFVKTYLWFLY